MDNSLDVLDLNEEEFGKFCADHNLYEACAFGYHVDVLEKRANDKGRELKPCPFCGGDDMRISYARGRYGIGMYAECTKCGARTRVVWDGKKDDAEEIAARLWNRREGGAL